MRDTHTMIARLNNGYHPNGTIPLPQYYADFAQRCANFAQASPGCTRWIIGNEMNVEIERPHDTPITPMRYAQCFDLCRSAIKAVPGHADDQVIIGAVGPWNNRTPYPGNESGDWIKYFEDIQRAITGCDGFAIHTYARAQTVESVKSNDRMGAPFQDYHNGFRTYVDWMDAVLPRFRGLPVYCTETNANAPWIDDDTGFVQAAYQEIFTWNALHPDRPISCLALYRWEYDQWEFKTKGGVQSDFYNAVDCGYELPPITDPPIEPPIEPPDPEPPAPACIFEPVDYERIEAIVRRAVRDELARWVWAPVEMPDVE